MRLTSLTLAAIVSASSFACAKSGEDQTIPPVVLGMLDTAAATYDDGETQIFQVTRQVRLPFRRPNDGERPKGQVDPYPAAPFDLAIDSRTTVRFTLTNLDTKQHTVELLIDPWNEFVHYVPGVTVERERTIPNPSGIDRYFVVPPRDRIEGIITPDDMQELAVDLVTAMALQKRPPAAGSAFDGPTLYNRAFNVQNRSTEPDPVLAPWIPHGPIDVVTGFDLGLRTSEPAKVAVEITVDLEDLVGDRVLLVDDDAKNLGPPGTTISPPASTREQ